MMQTGGDTRIVATEVVVTALVGDEIVLLDLDRGLYYGLNPSAARIWRLLEAGKPVSDVVSNLAAEHEVSPAELERDVICLIDALLEKALVTHLPS